MRVARDDQFSRHFDRMQEKRKGAMPVGDDETGEKPPPVEQAKTAQTAGRNDPCPCGSGRKFKKCCGKQ